jgi:hypothetical protein
MLLGLALLLAAADPVPQPTAQTLIQRLQQRFAANPALAASFGRSAPQMSEAAWLVGSWDVSAVLEERGGPPASGTSVIAPALAGVWLEIRDSYEGGQQNLAYLGYSVSEGRWIIAAVDGLANANRGSAAAWTGGRIAFEGDFVILGLPAHLRQTVERTGPDAFTVTEEELVGDRWHRFAVRYYRRRAAG